MLICVLLRSQHDFFNSVAPKCSPYSIVNAYGTHDLSMVRIGARLKHARLLIGINLRTAAELAGITESYLSKLENDRVRPSLATLHRIANALDTNISALTSETEPSQGYATVIKQEQRPAIEFGDDGDNAEGIRLEKLMPSSPGNLLQANVHVVSPGGGSKEQISHRGQEFGYVLEGSLQLIVCDETYEISAGDAFSFNSSLPHCYHNVGDITARIVWVNTPPTF